MSRKNPTPQRPESALLERDGFISSEDLAVYLDVPVSTLDQWASRGGGPVFRRVGKYRRYLPADVKSWQDGLPLGGLPASA